MICGHDQLVPSARVRDRHGPLDGGHAGLGVERPGDDAGGVFGRDFGRQRQADFDLPAEFVRGGLAVEDDVVIRKIGEKALRVQPLDRNLPRLGKGSGGEYDPRPVLEAELSPLRR